MQIDGNKTMESTEKISRILKDLPYNFSNHDSLNVHIQTNLKHV